MGVSQQKWAHSVEVNEKDSTDRSYISRPITNITGQVSGIGYANQSDWWLGVGGGNLLWLGTESAPIRLL